MPIAEKERIIQEFKKYIEDIGGDYSEWYAGIASDAEERLFDEHGVDKNGFWIYDDAGSSGVAREIEMQLFELGIKGDTGGGDENSKYVYAYRITEETNE